MTFTSVAGFGIVCAVELVVVPSNWRLCRRVGGCASSWWLCRRIFGGCAVELAVVPVRVGGCAVELVAPVGHRGTEAKMTGNES